MAGIRTSNAPRHVDGPSLVAVASGLMLLPTNASRHVRLHRLAALGMALAASGAAAVSPSAARSLLKQEDIGGQSILMLEDPYSDVLVQSITFSGGPYLVSGGSGEHTVADLENLIDAAFRKGWMPEGLQTPARKLVQALLTVSDMVLTRAGLTRGTAPGGSARTPIDVPGAGKLKALTDATFISNEELSARGEWLRMAVDTLALDPGQLVNPCAEDYTDDRLYVTPFLRLPDGYRVVLPLDLAVTIRFHFLRLAMQEGCLEELGEHWREAALRRFTRLLPPGASLVELERSNTLDRYLSTIDGKRDLHVIVATDPLDDWKPVVWGSYDTQAALRRISALMSPSTRSSYSSAEELVHVVLTDSPGRGASWGVPNVDSADPMLIARADDLEVILHQEPDGMLGLLLFAQAIENRPGRSISTDILDEFTSYADRQKSFYFSDDRPPDFVAFQTGDGLAARLKHYVETDPHGVAFPGRGAPILQVQRRYERDAPEIFLTAPNSSYIGCVVELNDQTVFITFDLKGAEYAGVETDLLDAAAYWVRECALLGDLRASGDRAELVLALSDPQSWKRVGGLSTMDSPVQASPTGSSLVLEFTETFVVQLQEDKNTAERELVAALLTNLFGVASAELDSKLDTVAPLGSKRMLHVFSQDRSGDMLSENLPAPLTGHEQVAAQLLDQVGVWLRSLAGGGFPIGALSGQDRVRVLNAAVSHLFEQFECEIAVYDRRVLLDFLVSQNESLVHRAKLNAKMLRSRLACFGEQSDTVAELVNDRKDVAAAHRANRFLIEYVAAQPPTGTRSVAVLDYYRLLSVAREITERATTSDFLHYDLADFEVSILESGRLGVSREQPVTTAIETYANNSGMRSVRDAMGSEARDGDDAFDSASFITHSEQAMRAEFGFTLSELREVCGGLLDLAIADEVTHIDRSLAVSEIATNRGLSVEVVSSVVSGITLTQRSSFLSIGPDAWPWRFNRDMSYVRRPLVLQDGELVFGFRSIYRLGVYWADSLLSGRLQGRAMTIEMRQFISESRGKINEDFARSVATRLQRLGMTTRVSVKKVGKQRIVDSAGKDLGDIDVLAVDTDTRSIIAVEAKDFEVARTPAEIANELEKLFSGRKEKKPTIELHGRRIDWLRQHIDEAILSLKLEGDPADWRVVGVIVTSDPLITPLVRSSPIPVIPLEDLTLDSLNLTHGEGRASSRRKRNRGR